MNDDVHYEYHSEDRSLILRGLQKPVLLPIARALPRWLTPNHVTMIGHVCLWAAAAFAFVAPMGRLVLLVLSFGYNAFNVSDTIDGLFARVSGRTSALGELLDHGLDPVSLGLVLLTWGLVMRQPGWLVLAGAGTVSFVHFLTFLNGYRTGQVILGEIGVIEGLAAATVFTGAAALGAYPFLTTAIFHNVSIADALTIGFVMGGFSGLFSMRALVRHAGDAVPPLVLDAIIAVWFAAGRITVPVAGLLLVMTTGYQSMMLISSRLRRTPLVLWDLPLLVFLAGAVVTSIALGLSAGMQAVLAASATLYALIRAARLFILTAQAVRRGAGSASAPTVR